MSKLKRGLLYLSLHNQLKKTRGVGNLISRKDFFTILGKHFLIPKNIRIVVIKEMQEMELVEQQDRDNIKVLECDIDIERDASKLYEMARLF